MATTSLPIDPNSPSHETHEIDSSEKRLDQLVIDYKKAPILTTEENAHLIEHIREQLGSDQLFVRWLQKLHEDLSNPKTPTAERQGLTMEMRFG
jgi:hypothetical protein